MSGPARRSLALLQVLLWAPAASLGADAADLDSIYRRLHAAPELSHHEASTAALVAGELRRAGFEVVAGLGKFSRPDWQGHGLLPP